MSLICVFGIRQFSCGTSTVYSGEPLLVQEEDYSAKVFVQSTIPRSWHEMEYQCRSSGGHLVSIDTQVKKNKTRDFSPRAGIRVNVIYQRRLDPGKETLKGFFPSPKP